MGKLKEDRRCRHCGFVMERNRPHHLVLFHTRNCASNPDRLSTEDRRRDYLELMNHVRPTMLMRKKRYRDPERASEMVKRDVVTFFKMLEPWKMVRGGTLDQEDFFRTGGKRYDVIYADPPWEYSSNQWYVNYVNSKYPTLSNENIYHIPVHQLAKENCMLFMWVVSPKLPDCLRTLERWGFRYKTVFFNWIKTYKKKGTLVKNAIGSFTRPGSEMCVVATRGKMTGFRQSFTVDQVFVSPREEHSQKPPVVFDMLEEFFGTNYDVFDKIELFSRDPSRIGWDHWGNEC